MLNPFQEVAKTLVSALTRQDQSQWQNTIAAVLATVSTKSQQAMRARVQVLSVDQVYERETVEHLDNAHHYMKIKAAKSLGLNILSNPAICLIERKTEDDKVTFSIKVALVPKEDW